MCACLVCVQQHGSWRCVQDRCQTVLSHHNVLEETSRLVDLVTRKEIDSGLSKCGQGKNQLSMFENMDDLASLDS